MIIAQPQGRKRCIKSALWSAFSLVVCLPLIFPLYWVLISSLKSDAEIFASPPTLLPSTFYFDNYLTQIMAPGAFQSILNSGLIALGSLALSLCLSIPCAYGLARYQMPGKKVFMMSFLVTQMLPCSLVLTPLFLTYNRVGLLNTYWAPILSTATISIPFIVLVMRPAFMAYPKELEEAARIDGCNRFTAFLRIIVPISKNGMITAVTFAFIFGWNDLVYSITFNSKENLRPMTATIYNYIDMYGTRWNMIMTYGILLVLPIVLIFIFLQRYIVDGLVSGSVKG